MNSTTETTTNETNMSHKEINVTDLLADLEKIQKELAQNSSNANAFFLVINGVIIYCEYLKFMSTSSKIIFSL